MECRNGRGLTETSALSAITGSPKGTPADLCPLLRDYLPSLAENKSRRGCCMSMSPSLSPPCGHRRGLRVGAARPGKQPSLFIGFPLPSSKAACLGSSENILSAVWHPRPPHPFSARQAAWGPGGKPGGPGVVGNTQLELRPDSS